jgi:hypothetical protein
MEEENWLFSTILQAQQTGIYKAMLGEDSRHNVTADREDSNCNFIGICI